MSRFNRFALLALLLLGITACTSKPVLNISSSVPPAAAKSQDDMRRAILTALQRRQWTIERADKGQILASITRRSHEAQISIPYTASSYSIRYRDSHNLGYSDGKIHRNYNKWVLNLDRSIQQELRSPSLPMPQ
ncbi:hypothetical protein [Phytopseudomonas punonensis]|uniref:Lipoprotein n=1 Tax=Phytopseudomonas punonensis TaxID=1220495 RepID=A0A1M6Z6L0_9GAMM|nr:hypothetical protein [Pseudomonas punonensis]SHL26088.1 hypothetical protein SAMN05216288_1500 [Pseudomonas punonensis]